MPDQESLLPLEPPSPAVPRFRLSGLARGLFLYTGVVLPVLCFLFGYPNKPDWQSGAASAYAQLYLSPRGSLPFYPLLAAPLLTGAVAANFFQSRLWRGAALAVFAVAALLLVVSAPRPLWPAVTVLRALDAPHSTNYWLRRSWNVYFTYGSRADGFAPVIAALPPDANPLGFIAFDEPEAGLWRPFGARRILHFCREDSPADLRARGIKYALVSERFFEQHSQMQTAEWLQRMNAETVRRFELKLLAGHPPYGWLLVRLP